MVACILSGSNAQMLQKEGELQRKGFRQVQGPEIGLMQYCRIHYQNGKDCGFHLFWIEEGRTISLDFENNQAA